MMSVDIITAGLIDECPRLADPTIKQQEWSFLERYPDLGFVVRRDPVLAKQLDLHYRKMVEFVERYVAPKAVAIDRKLFSDPDYLPEQLLQKACEYRLFSMMFPKVLGGAGVHPLAAFMTYELIASHCVGIANLLGVSSLAIACVMATYDPRALSVLARLICDNERQGIPTFISTCVTEPGAGSDAEDADEFAQALLRTTAKKVAGGYLLTGNKVFISNGSLAALHVVTAYDADGHHRPEDLLVLLVAADAKGVSIARNEKKMGQKVCPASEVVFDEVFVPDDMRCRTIGTQHNSFAYAGMSNVLGLTRAGVGGFAAGVAEGAYRTALNHARHHHFLGQPMEQQQWVRMELAHLARRAQVARSSYMAALFAVASFGLAEPLVSNIEPRMIGWLCEWLGKYPTFKELCQRLLASDIAYRWFKRIERRQTLVGRETATAFGDVAKVSCTELAMENCQKALTLMGKAGFRHEQGAEKLLRDVKLLQIYEGTNQLNMLDFIKRRVTRQFVTRCMRTERWMLKHE